MSESLLSKSSFVSKLLKSKKFRDGYVYEHIRNGIPFQIRALRNERKWTQSDLGQASGKPRPVISRLEDPNYGKLSIKTLLEIASAFEVALLIKFVPFSRLVREYEDVSWQALSAKSISDEEEIANLRAWETGTSATTNSPYVEFTVKGSGITVRIEPNQMINSAAATIITPHHGGSLPITASVSARKDNVLSPSVRGGTAERTITFLEEKKAA